MRPSRPLLLPVLLLAAMLASAGQAAPLRIAVAIVPHAWLAEQVGGDLIEVRTIVPPGADPHVFQPADAEISRLMRCHAVFRAGIPLERGPWMEAMERSGRVRVVDLREGVALRAMAPGEAHHHHPGGVPCTHEHEDPHTWTTPANLRIQARTIARTLRELAPASAATIDESLARVDELLARLDDELRTTLTPCRDRAFLVLHPAWGYFADAYGVRQVAVEIAGLAPSDVELTALQRLARTEGIATILVQPQVSPRTARAVADAIGGEVVAVDPLARDVPATLRKLAATIAGPR